MESLHKPRIPRRLVLAASLCAIAGPHVLAQSAAPDAVFGGRPAQSRSQNAAVYCDRYAASEFDDQNPVLGLPFNRVDPKVAIPICSKAVSLDPNSPRLNFELGRAYSANKDYSKAREYFSKAADANFALAQANLGSLYLNGLGVRQDYEAAEKWDRLAAEQGLAPAQSDLGVSYLQGRGVSKDYAEAARWLRAATLQGFAPAEYGLAALYASGRGVKQDIGEALRLYGLAANQGYGPAQANFPSLLEADGPSAQSAVDAAARQSDLVSDQRIESAATTGEKPESGPPGDLQGGGSTAGDARALATPPTSVSAPASNDVEPQASAAVATGQVRDVLTPGRLTGETAGAGDASPVKIVVKQLDHRNSSGIPTTAIEVLPLSNKFSMSSLSVNNGACRVYIQDPTIFSPGRFADQFGRPPKDASESDKIHKNQSVALDRISLPKAPFGQPIVAEFGQYLQFYADPSVCDIKEVAVVVNDHEWKWSPD